MSGSVTLVVKELSVGEPPQGVRQPLELGAIREDYAPTPDRDWKAILTNLLPERADEIIEFDGLTQLISATITDEQRLHAELETGRERGYAVD